jgi:hypothetical protein
LTPTSPKINALVVSGLAAIFAFAQYKIAQLPIRPFNLDPCDAVAHFVILVIAFVVAISLFRALSTNGSVSSGYILRCQQTFAMALFTGLLADVVDLARHPSVWVASASRNQMLAWIAVYVLVALSMQSLLQATQPRSIGSASRQRKWATLVFLAIALILFVCPEYGIQHTSETAHILTVTVGVFVVLIPLRVLLPVLVPGPHEERLFLQSYREWGCVVIGIAMFALAFWSQFHEIRVFSVPSKVISGNIGAVLMACGFLADPLGLIHDSGDFEGDSQEVSA